MKKKSLLNFWLLLLCMIAGAGTAWGEEAETIASFTIAEHEDWSITNAEYASAGGGYYKLISSDASIVSPSISWSEYSNITITIAARKYGGPNATQGKISVSQGETELTSYSPSGTSIVASSALSISPTDGTITISCPEASNSKGCGVQSVIIKGTKVGSSKINCDLALEGSPIALSFDLYDNATAQVINYTTSSTGAVTIADSEYGTFAINETAKTITVTPTAVTPSMQTITVNQAADATYKAGSVTFTVTVTDSTPIPTHTATFSVNGNTTTQEFEEGADISFPENPSDIYGKKFVGWATTAIDGTTDEAPEFVTSATMGNADITYYAVFAELIPGEQTEVTDVLTRATTGITGNSYSNWSGKSVTSSALYAGNSAGDNESIQLRSNNSNSGVVSTTSGGKLSKVVIVWNQSTTDGRVLNVYGSNTAYESASDLYNNSKQGTLLFTSTKTNEALNTEFEQTIDGDYKYIGFRSNSGAMYIKSVSITWVSGTPDTYSEYCTTVVAAAVEKPVITVAENPFMFSTTATITCATDGAAIYYSYDNENWTEYKAALNITATTTIYAKATKGNDESSVAQVTATKNLAEPTVTIDATGITNTNVFEGTEAGSLSASVTYNEADVEGAVVAWSGNNDEVATINASTGVVTLVSAGSVTFTATYAGNGDYSEKTATYEMTVTNSDPNAPGTENNPYTVAQALEVIEELDDNGTIDDVYVSGYVSTTGTVSSGTITYYISVDGTTTSQLQVYKGKGLNNKSFTSDEDIEIYDKVTVFGQLKKYVNKSNVIPEFNSGNYLISQTHRSANTITVEGGTTKNVDRSAGGEETLITLSATATNGATVTYSIDTENTTLNENNYLLEGSDLLIGGTSAGIIKIIASAAGDLDYYDATETITINVAGEKDTPITYTTNVSKAYGQTLTLVSGEDFLTDGVVTLESSNTSVATIDGLTVTAAAVGTATITVTYAEGTQYKATTSEFTFTVTAPEGGTAAYNPEGETVTLDFTTNTWDMPTSNTTGTESYSNGTYTVTVYAPTNYKLSSNYLYLGKSGAYIVLPTFDKVVTQIDVEGTSGASQDVKQNIYVTVDDEDIAVSTETKGAKDVTNKYIIDSKYQAVGTAYKLKVMSNHNTQISSIVVHFAAEPLTVTLSESGYATYCSEYPLDFTNNDKQTYRAWYVSNVSGTTVTFSEITGKVKSGTPIILYGTPKATCELASVANENTLSDNMLEGTLAPTYVASDEDITYFGLSNGKFVKMTAGVVKANKAYLPLLTEDIPSGARLNIVFENGDTPTGIRSIENDQLTNGTYYNLNGQRVENLKKGNLYIVNGKKILVK